MRDSGPQTGRLRSRGRGARTTDCGEGICRDSRALGGGTGYFDYFGATAGDRGKGYYSYGLGSWHIIVLNSNCGAVACSAGSAQEQWLRDDLAAHPVDCTLAYWHHPRFSSGDHGNNGGVAAFWTALYEGGADVVLGGHDHSYERFSPQTSGAQPGPAHGIRQFVVGTGGRSHCPFRTIRPNSVIRHTGTFGVLKSSSGP